MKVNVRGICQLSGISLLQKQPNAIHKHFLQQNFELLKIILRSTLSELERKKKGGGGGILIKGSID